MSTLHTIMYLSCKVCHLEGSGKQGGLKLNGTHHFLVYADCVNVLNRQIYTTKMHTEPLAVTSRKTGSRLFSKKMLRKLSTQTSLETSMHDKITIQREINTLFEGVEQFKYLRTTLTKQFFFFPPRKKLREE